MCGGYTFIPGDGFLSRFEISGNPYDSLPRNFNVRPGAVMPVIIREDGKNILMPMQWGLVPPWAKDPKIGYKMFNARSETVAEKPSFKGPFRRSRCLVPVSGFYEWKPQPRGKQPYYFIKGEEEMMALAGLYEISYDADQLKLLSYTILTKGADKVVSHVHKRMPVVLDENQEADWLDEKADEADLEKLLKQELRFSLQAYPVSKRVNFAQNNSPELIKQIREQ